jgi:(2R)-sulfolactate sulfo-lyase subunit alpha
VGVKFLIHEPGDSVGVAVVDIKAGEKVAGTYMHDPTKSVEVTAKDDIPLGHKIALADMRNKAKVIKYGVVIGGAVKAIRTGEHVHVHNVKSLRWGK